MRLPVFINTCDKFRDCWNPFFRCWEKFGPKTLDCPLYLCTERADYHYGNLPITACKVCEYGNWQQPTPPTWSWCTGKGLEQIEGDFVLYLQEDYFLKKQMNEEHIADLVRMMERDSDIHCIHVTEYGITKHVPTDKEPLVKGDRMDKFYGSLQAAIWRKETLLNLLREKEDAWDFEQWGTRRARYGGINIYLTDRRNGELPFDYVFTGIIQGKWIKACVPFFKEMGIDMDFSRRGFYEGPFGPKKGRFFAWWACRLKLIFRERVKRVLFPRSSYKEVQALKKSYNRRNAQ